MARSDTHAALPSGLLRVASKGSRSNNQRPGRSGGTRSGIRQTMAIHPATRTFQALRIAVNHELEGLDQFVETAVDLLQPDGRFVAISFHSLEDRIMKQEFRRLSGYCQCGSRSRAPVVVCTCGARNAVEILTKRPVVPDAQEIDANPRSRSAKLRACRKALRSRDLIDLTRANQTKQPNAEFPA